MNRNRILSIFTGIAWTAAAVAQQNRPNVIVVLADDLGFGDVSAYGSKTISTPNIDRLARGGACFTNAYATSATSTPSRYGLMTGVYPWRNPEGKILPGDAPLIIGENEFTLPRMMQQAGYATGAIGKWHLGMGKGKIDWNKTVTPGANQIGFDYSCLIAATNDRVPTVYIENGNVVGLDPNDPIYVDYEKNFPGEPSATENPEMLRMRWHHGHNNSIVNGIPRIGYMKGGTSARWRDEDMADYFVGKVKRYISENADHPFFLYYGLHEPHVPRAPHERFAGATTMGPRGDAIIEADWCVGELIAHLEKEGILDNTIIIFSSDNGPVLQDGYYDDAVKKIGNHSPTGGLRGGKYSLFDGGTHVPFFIYWKKGIKPTVSSELVCQMDLLPSIAKLIDAKVPAKIDGVENLDAFMGRAKSKRQDLVIEAKSKVAFRTGPWVMIPPYSGKPTNVTGNELGNLKEYALFNLEQDPNQQNNLAEKYPEVLNDLKQRLAAQTDGQIKNAPEPAKSK